MPGGYGQQNNFPKTAKSVPEWLAAIGMSQYADAFAAEGIETSQLRSMSNTTIRQIIPVEGHKRRLMLALNELEAPSASGPSAPIAVAPAPKYNSTSSLYIDSTISRPCVDEIIFCVSIVIHDRIDEGECELAANPTMMDKLPDMFNTKSKPLLAQLAADDASEDSIFQSIKAIYSIAEFSPECLVISLLYIERVRSLTGLHLLISNWQPILLASMVVAQKVWDDKSLLNVDFSLICSAYSLKDINQLEKQLLVMLQYNVSISASLYASYYFELRTLCEKAERTFSLKPLSEEQQQALVSRAEMHSEELQHSTRRWQSLGTNLQGSSSGAGSGSHVG